MGWRIVEVATDEYMQLYLNNLQITRPGEKILLNLAEIDVLIVQNHRASISINLLNALASNNISTIFMDAQREPTSYLVPVSGHHASLKVLERQLAWTNQYKGLAWKRVVQNKILNQKALLERLKVTFEAEYFVEMANHTKEFDVDNREGHAAKVCWHALFGVSFIRDQKANTERIKNSMLNYGYAILRAVMIKAIIMKGLDARISLFHKSFTNFFALASDLMEPFRPLVDEIVYANRAEMIFSLEIRDQLVGILEKTVAVNGTRFYLPKACEKVVDSLISGNGWAWVDLWD